MGNKVVMVGPKGSAIIDAMTAWEEFAHDNGLDSTARMISRTKEERYKYYSDRDEWIAVWLLENYGYDYASYYVELNCTNNITLRNKFASIMPCKYNECNLYCKRYERCLKEGFIENAVD